MALKQALCLYQSQAYKHKSSILNKTWYVSCIHTRFGVYVFKLYSDTNVYNNRITWEIRNILNNIIDYNLLNIETFLNIKVINGVLIYSCLGFEYGIETIGLYFHSKTNGFIYSKLVVAIVASYSCKRHGLINLARILSRQCLSVNINSISNILKSNYIYNVNNVIFNMINNFSRRNDCVIDVQCIIALI